MSFLAPCDPRFACPGERSFPADDAWAVDVHTHELLLLGTLTPLLWKEGVYIGKEKHTHGQGLCFVTKNKHRYIFLG